jgi:fucose permease
MLAVLCPVLALLLFGAGGCLLGPLLPAIAMECRVPVDIAGSLLAMTFVGSIVAIMLGGVLADRFGKKRIFLIALTLYSLSYLLLSQAHSFPLIAAACLLAGAFGGAVEGLCVAVIADLDPPRVDRNVTLLQIAFNVGAVIAIGGTAWLRQSGGAWRTAYLIMAVFGLVVMLLGFGMRVPDSAPVEPLDLPMARKLLTDPLVVALAVGIACYVGSEMSLGNWISPLLEGERTAPAQAMLGAGLFWAVMGVGRFISAAACRRHHGYTVLRVLVLGGLLSYGLFLLPLGPARLWVAAVATGLTFSGVWPLLVSLGGARHPAYSGTVSAILVASGTVGALIFPFLIGVVIARLSPAWGLGLMAALFLLLFLVVWGPMGRQYAGNSRERAPLV